MEIVKYICTNAMNHHQFMELLKETEDDEFNDDVFSASVHWKSWKNLTKVHCTVNSNSRFS